MAEKNLIDRLNKRIEIQEKALTPDGFGGFIEEWKKMTEIWSEIKPIDIIENFEMNKIQEKVTHVITIRYLKFLTAKERIKYNDRIFNIKGIMNLFEQNKILQINVEEII